MAAGVEAVPGDAVRSARPVVGDEVYDFAAGEIVDRQMRVAGARPAPLRTRRAELPPPATRPSSRSVTPCRTTTR